jgi:nucleoside-diphosphate-sugar epimerase
MILLTGGAGYIGSHVSVALLNAGLDVVAVDNLSNSNEASLERAQTICGRSLVFRHADVCNEEAIYEIVRAYEVTAVIPRGVQGGRRFQRSARDLLREQLPGNDAAGVSHDESKREDPRF